MTSGFFLYRERDTLRPPTLGIEIIYYNHINNHPLIRIELYYSLLSLIDYNYDENLCSYFLLSSSFQ